MTNAEARFGDFYGRRRSRAEVQVEIEVFGAEIGANGYTTLSQARELATATGLGPGGRLLEVGAGLGWPGLHIARETGCDVILTDAPITAVRGAALRARATSIGSRASCVAASASHLPFRPGTFDAVTHADVL